MTYINILNLSILIKLIDLIRLSKEFIRIIAKHLQKGEFFAFFGVTTTILDPRKSDFRKYHLKIHSNLGNANCSNLFQIQFVEYYQAKICLG